MGGDWRGIRAFLKWLAFGSWSYPQFCDIGLYDPQTEVRVWLHGVGAPRDVTHESVLVCLRPLAVGIVFDDATTRERARASLRVCEGGGQNRLLGELVLRRKRTIPAGHQSLDLFEVEQSRNYCLPTRLLWRRYLDYAYHQWRAQARSDGVVRMVSRDVHAQFVFYICPRPVFLVSVTDGEKGNMFPMDLVGPIGKHHFSLALHSTLPAALLERSRRMALSSIPAEQSSVAYMLAKNHKRTEIAWNELPFGTTKSPTFGLPVPSFALRVRELQIESVWPMGSHTLFLARVTGDERRRDGPQMFQVHGFFEAWRHQAGSRR
jgi:flavin reductase (DIM6/NTAB) family NADH-FMN oxidoreductase RutF